MSTASGDADLHEPPTRAALRRLREIDGDDPDRATPGLHTMVALNPHAEDDAARLEAERRDGRVRGPLHGVPVVVKDNIDVAGIPTTAGSLALAGNVPTADAPLVRRLREAGAVVLGKSNLSEWANFRSTRSTSGWSATGGLTLNPHALDRSAGGSSSGSAAAVAAGITRYAVGTETDGSITCPAALCGVVGIKPTVGLIAGSGPEDGVVPVAHSQDTPGPIAATVAEAATLLDVLAGTGRRFADASSADDVHGLRIGLPRRVLWGYSPEADAMCERAVSRLSALGVAVVDPADLPGIAALAESEAEAIVLHTEFKVDLETYLARCPDGVPRTLAELVAWNLEHADEELVHFGQERFERALATRGLDDPAYLEALAECRRLGRDEGIDGALRAYDLDALAMPTYPPAWKIDLVNGDHVTGACAQPSAIAGYPIVTVPCGAVDGLPVGLAFAGTAGSEETLIRLAATLERDLALAYRAPSTG